MYATIIPISVVFQIQLMGTSCPDERARKGAGKDYIYKCVQPNLYDELTLY